MVICLERVADLHMSQLMPLPPIVSCFGKIQIGFTFLVPAHPGSPGQRAVKWVRVCVGLVLCFTNVVMHELCVLPAGCFRNITTGVTGHVDSPNYPHKYLINSTCEWLVTARHPHSRLLLTFDVFSMEGDTDSQSRARGFRPNATIRYEMLF